MRAEPRGRSNPPSTDLPAPYRSPWKRLGEDLEAVGADLGLRARELWRRNGEGSLWRPPVWPRSAAPAFWPLVLVAILVLAVLVVRLGFRREPPPVPAAAVERTGPISETAPSFEPAAPPPPPPSIATPTVAPPTVATPTVTAPSVTAEGEPEPGNPAVPDPALEPAPDLEALALPSPEPGPEEVLQAAFGDLDAEGVIVALRPDAATAVLQLEVGEGFARLEPRRRRKLAEDWAVRAAERGYERLEVVDGRGRLWARPAAVGGGLVVLGYPLAPEPGCSARPAGA